MPKDYAGVRRFVLQRMDLLVYLLKELDGKFLRKEYQQPSESEFSFDFRDDHGKSCRLIVVMTGTHHLHLSIWLDWSGDLEGGYYDSVKISGDPDKLDSVEFDVDAGLKHFSHELKRDKDIRHKAHQLQSTALASRSVNFVIKSH
jgi:hypothetical protein